MATNFNNAKKLSAEGENDSYWTQLETILKETFAYPYELFRDKGVFLNCDEGKHSNFYVWGNKMFEKLRLKRVSAVGYNKGASRVRVDVIYRDEKGNKIFDYYYLEGEDGSFDGEQSIKLMREHEIVMTNPPFSLMKYFFPLVMSCINDPTAKTEYFSIISNIAATGYKEIWPYFFKGQVWWGDETQDVEFEVPLSYEPRNNRYREVIVDGELKKYRSLGNIRWFTNFPIEKRNYLIKNRTKKWERGLADGTYKEYDNYKGVYEMNRVENIPCDLPKGTRIGVPFTFLDKHNPNQFKLIGILTAKDDPENGFFCGEKMEYKDKDGAIRKAKKGIIDGKCYTDRIIIEKL